MSQSLFVGAPRDDGSGIDINPGHDNLTTDSGALYQFKVTQSLLAPIQAPTARAFRRGDANADGELSLADPVFTLGALFLGETEPTCADAADADDNGKVDVTDPVYLLNFLFTGGAPPALPFAECGQDPTVDNLRCDSFPSC